jgi:sucrose-6-phosphate hydrolase SacC (GH32 family)
MLAALLFTMVPPAYDEPYRPQFHFSARRNWLNDPNGLVYFDGQFHLFFQHNPTGIQWGNMHWGHAVSPDLFHWTELPPALGPDALGTVFSGSAAVDWKNTCGLGAGPGPVLAAMYTAAGDPFVQCLATSIDEGRTWTKYAGNPVLKNLAHENRDPRIFWYAPTQKWIMALYLSGDEYAIFGSPDLKTWTELSRLHIPGSSECPELFEMAVDGAAHETRWIFYGGNFHYVVGRFDGTTFHADSAPIPGDQGDSFYASQTWNNAPGGRRIQIGWMRGDGPLPGMPFNQQMSCPCELHLRRTPAGLRLTRRPVPELDRLHGMRQVGRAMTFAEANAVLARLPGDTFDLRLRLPLSADQTARLLIRGTELTISAKARTISLLGSSAALALTHGGVELRILVDRSSIEVFADDGQVSITKCFTPPLDRHGITLESENASARVNGLEAFEVRSAWK